MINTFLIISIPIGVAGAAVYAAAYFYVRRYRNIFKQLGIPYLPADNWTGIWAEYANADDMFEFEKHLVNKNGGIYGVFEGRQPILVVSQLELVRQVLLKDFDSFTDRRTMGTARRTTGEFAMTLLNGARWKHVRQQVTPAFTPQALRRMYPLIWRTVEQLSDNIAENPNEIDVKTFCGCFTMDVIASVAFGMELDSLKNPENPFVTNAKLAFAVDITKGTLKYFMSIILMFPCIIGFVAKLIPKNSKLMAPSLFFEKIVEDEMKRRRAAVGEVERPDFLQMVMHLEKDPNDHAFKDYLEYDEFGFPWLRNGLTHQEIVAQAMLFFLAGYETTANVLSLVLFALARNPECQERLFAEINEIFPKNQKEPSLDAIYELKYLDMCINETMRMDTPLLRLERACVNDTNLGGFHIPKDMIVQIPAYAIHQNPNVWPDPEKFDPERFSPENSGEIDPISFLPFGQGNRNCIGMRLAYLELKLALVDLVRRFRFSVSAKTELPVKWKPSFLRTPANPILLQATLR